MDITVITFGTFDVFHYGHLRLLNRALQYGDRLVVGVSTDALSELKKGRIPVYSESERLSIVRGLRCVDFAFLEESLEDKGNYLEKYDANVLVMGDDWKGRFDEYKANCDVVYLDRTPSISTTAVIEKIRHI